MKKIKIGMVGGAFGLGRGTYIIDGMKKDMEAFNAEITAICDINVEALKKIKENYPDLDTYSSIDDLVKSDIDAVVLMNYFHDHAPLAIKALNAGKHVLSETTACRTMAQAVELVEAVEKSGKVYMLAENYPYNAATLAMKEIYDNGDVGKVRYAEGQYIHPTSYEELKAISPGEGKHWRYRLPATHYVTHAIAPLMHITNTYPVEVSAYAVPILKDEEEEERIKHAKSDNGAIIVCRMSDDSVFRVLTGFSFAFNTHEVSYRLFCTDGLLDTGLIEGGMVREKHNEFSLKGSQKTLTQFKAEFPSDYQFAKGMGHGGGDGVIMAEFINTVRDNGTHFFDVYRAVSMAAVEIFGFKSASSDNGKFEIPDLSKKDVRDIYRNDHWSPWLEDKDLAPNQPSSQIYEINL